MEEGEVMEARVFKMFYSWQSDLPKPLNMSFIEDALKKATKKINKDSVEFEAVIDRDTKGEAGSPDITQTIFAKIEKSDIFVCDVSIINTEENSRPTPNPNILVELGYALKTLGPNRIIMVMNEAYGQVEKLPFDLRMRRVLKYNINWDDKKDPDKSPKRKGELVNHLSDAIQSIINQITPQSLKESLKAVDDKERHSRERFISAVRCAIEKIEPNLILPSFVDQYQTIEDEFEKFFVIFDGQSYFWHVYDKKKLIEYTDKITSLLDAYITVPEIKRQLFTTVRYDDLLPKQSVEVASLITPLIEQESPSILDIYFRILAILDRRTSSWKPTFENQFSGFEEQTIVDEINAKQHYIEQIDTLRLEILKWSFSPGR